MQGYLKKGIQTPMAQGRSTETISTMKWIRISGLSTEKTLSKGLDVNAGCGLVWIEVRGQGAELGLA